LMQTEDFRAPAELFRADYPYFSSYSDTWLEHCRHYAQAMMARLRLDPGRLVIEVASNDGGLLQYFKQAGVPVLGIEPAANVARVAERERGVATLVRFFGSGLARQLREQGQGADLLVANNVLAHVQDINDFVAAIGIILKSAGIVTAEIPHLLRLIEGNQFDTIYHEHYSYFSLLTLTRIFAAHGMEVFDVETLTTHGGSLRIFARHRSEQSGPPSPAVESVLQEEQQFGLGGLETYKAFDQRVRQTKRDLLSFMIAAKNSGKTIVGYGAPAKASTLLNYCGIRADFLDYTVDRNPHKQGLFMPGTGIPIRTPETIFETKPDYVFILPWNLRDEIMTALAGIREWGGQFLIAIPRPQVL
jgi:SAM-dependent methyltransferase